VRPANQMQKCSLSNHFEAWHLITYIPNRLFLRHYFNLDTKLNERIRAWG